MPRDGSINRRKILASAEAEFLRCGFERATIRAIAKGAGVSSAALYRHFPDKHAIFEAIVAPGVEAADEWMAAHESLMFDGASADDAGVMGSQSDVDMMREVVFPNRSVFRLLLCCAQGTRYANYIHDLTEKQQAGLERGIAWLRDRGYAASDANGQTLHMMLSAYNTALFEPIVHDYPEQDAMAYYETVERFFLPGWYDLLGISGQMRTPARKRKRAKARSTERG